MKEAPEVVSYDIPSVYPKFCFACYHGNDGKENPDGHEIVSILH